MLSQKESAHNSTRPGLPCPMTLSKLLGSRSMTLEARAPASRDSEKIDNENFIKYVQWVEPREERRVDLRMVILPLHHPGGRRGLPVDAR